MKTAREIAEELKLTLIDCGNIRMDHANCEDREVGHIEQALRYFGQQEREQALRDSADICQRYIDDPYTSDTATEAGNIRNNILSLIDKETESSKETK